MLAAEKTIGQVVQALEISEQTFHRWRNQYGGMKAEEAKRLRPRQSRRRSILLPTPQHCHPRIARKIRAQHFAPESPRCSGPLRFSETSQIKTLRGTFLWGESLDAGDAGIHPQSGGK